jgi:N6-adenosine-specific RNA methylase IME4
MGLQAHPYAQLFPMLSEADGASLRADLVANGQHERIVLLDGLILDGRNRHRQLVAAGLVPDELPADDSDLWITRYRRFLRDQDGDPLAFVLSLNLHRRHLDETQRAIVADKLANMSVGRPAAPASADNSANLQNIPRADAAALLHVSERTVASVHVAREKGAPELVEAMERGEISASVGEAAAKALSVGEQIRALQERDPRAFSSFVREKRREQQDIKKAGRRQREADLGARQAALPDKRFGVILADPEWQFKPFSAETGMDRAPDNHYPTSSLEAIMARPVISIAADDCVLLLWATVPMLPEALAVMSAWGFTYKSQVVWRKAEPAPGSHRPGGLVLGTGYWFRNAHELLLLGTRGKVPAPAMGTQWPSMVDAAPLRHSQKPAFAHELAEAYFPSLRKIELNARERRAGWDAWGLEAPSDTHAASERIAMSKAEALPIIKDRYTGNNGQQLADELGRPLNTIRKWAFEAGVSSMARNAARGAEMVNGFNAKRETAS